MKETTEENTSNYFTMVPLDWGARKDVKPIPKLIVAYIYTRANIETIDWELVAADVVKMLGLKKGAVSNVMKWLEQQGVIHFTGWKRKGEKFPSKMFHIDRAALEKFMSPPPLAVHTANRHGSSCEPPRFKRRTATVSVANLEEEVNKKTEKKILEVEQKTERRFEQPPVTTAAVPESSTPKQSAVVAEFLSKSPREQVAWLDAADARKSLAKDLKDLKAGKDVAMTPALAEEFANL
jgi:hypothetical protein